MDMKDQPREVIIDGSDRDLARALVDAIDNASDQDRITWLTTAAGKRIAAIVPVDVAESHEQMIATVMRTPVGRIVVLDELRGFGALHTGPCLLCGHGRRAHTHNGETPEPRPEVDCQMCQDGKCRTPAAKTQHELVVAARSGLLSRRYR